MGYNNKEVALERQKLADLIVKNIEEKNCIVDPSIYHHLKQFNFQTGNSYKGLNNLKLIMASETLQTSDPRWLTFKQAQSLKFKIKKGSKGVKLEKYIFEEEKPILDENGNKVLDENGKEKTEMVKVDPPIVNHFVVFNGCQIEGIPEHKLEPLSRDENIKLAEDFIKSSKCPIEEKVSNKAYYMPLEDKIVLPLRDSFKSTESFLSTTIHEMGHSTGHESRLNRPLETFQGEAYAIEELNAEIASVFTRASLGLNLENSKILEQNTAYISAWCKHLKEHPKALVSACKTANQISDYLIDNYDKYKEREKENDKNKNVAKDNKNKVSKKESTLEKIKKNKEKVKTKEIRDKVESIKENKVL